MNRVFWCLRWSLTECRAGDGLHHSHSGYNTGAQATVTSEIARRIQLALPEKGRNTESLQDNVASLSVHRVF